MIAAYLPHLLINIDYGMQFAIIRSLLITMIYFIIYLFLSLAVSLLSLNKRISFIKIFIISLLLTPVMGLITVVKAENNILTHHYTTSNICASCGSDSFENDKVCSTCGEEILYSEEGKLKLA